MPLRPFAAPAADFEQERCRDRGNIAATGALGLKSEADMRGAPDAYPSVAAAQGPSVD